jgi:DNA repair exonuclease SbcCD ATPase subunit
MAIPLKQYRNAHERRLGEYEHIKASLQEHTESLKRNEARIKYIEEAQKVIQEVAMATQSQIVYRIEDIVNKVLQTTFPTYSFQLMYEVKRGKSEAVLNFYCGDELINIMEDSGGAVDMATMGLRFALWSLTNKSDTIILDEHLKFVSPDLQSLASEVLLEICHTLGVQVLLVSHIEALKNNADHVINVEKKGKYSKVVV